MVIRHRYPTTNIKIRETNSDCTHRTRSQFCTSPIPPSGNKTCFSRIPSIGPMYTHFTPPSFPCTSYLLPPPIVRTFGTGEGGFELVLESIGSEGGLRRLILALQKCSCVSVGDERVNSVSTRWETYAGTSSCSREKDDGSAEGSTHRGTTRRIWEGRYSLGREVARAGLTFEVDTSLPVRLNFGAIHASVSAP